MTSCLTPCVPCRLLDWLTSFRMGEDLADKVDEFICAWDKVVGTDLDTLVVLILGECRTCPPRDTSTRVQAGSGSAA